MKKLVFLLFVFVFNAQASSINSVKIEKVLVGPYFDNRVFIAVSPRPTGGPSCKTNANWDYNFDGTTTFGRMYLSVVLSAYYANKTINIAGTDTCVWYPSAEDLSWIQVQ